MDSNAYDLLPSQFGAFGIVWGITENGPRVYRVALPWGYRSAEQRIHAETQAPLTRAEIRGPRLHDLAARLQALLEGEVVDLPLNLLAWERCPAFQQRVLRAEHAIPRGWVSTYGRLARHLGIPTGARAVGNALARNPFPLFIPCHRAVRSDGSLGGYQGGLAMKRALLAFEGVEVDSADHIAVPRLWY